MRQLTALHRDRVVVPLDDLAVLEKKDAVPRLEGEVREAVAPLV